MNRITMVRKQMFFVTTAKVLIVIAISHLLISRATVTSARHTIHLLSGRTNVYDSLFKTSETLRADAEMGVILSKKKGINGEHGQSTWRTHKLHSRMEQNQRQETNAKYCPGNSPPCLNNIQ
ncbi:hypothetical protein EV421DRAFT_1848378 [Armillaria borealis]|uniref:Uncharacterized protein n=1 Tax=Armillaria borealis TaxID=47425 RepID=A0AA39IY34_9AGAR|nr:hypothetical protein EV421DRAFT_1848378 [Armillaria borealis]